MTERPDNLQDSNISAVFNILDSDQSGSITADDFDLIGRLVCDRLGVAVDSDNGRKVCGSYQAWWSRLREDLDVDNDGRVTQAEFAAIYQGGRGDPQEYFSKHIGPAAEVVADMMDTDGDGYISQDEYLALLASITDPQAALAGFRQLDTDGDGRISVAELQAGIKQVMLSNDASAPGTSMLVEH